MNKKVGAAAIVGALGIAAGGASLLSSGNEPVDPYPVPVLALSTLTLPNRDSVGVVINVFPKCLRGGRTTPACPDSLAVTVDLSSADGSTRVHSYSASSVNAGVRRVFAVSKSICPQQVSVNVTAAAVASDDAERSYVASKLLRVPCRALREAERVEQAALLDSFPKANRRVTTSSRFGYKLSDAAISVLALQALREARTADDSARVRERWQLIAQGADSVLMPTAADTLNVSSGYEYHICWLGKNRYTNSVTLLAGDAARCETVRAQYESERDA